VRNTKEDSWGDNLSKWVIPLFKSQTPQNEALSAQLAALAMMRGGTTSFVEAGTVIHMEAVMEALAATGLRGRVGQWVEGRAWDPAADTKEVADRAIKLLQDEVERWPDDGETLLAAWPVLVGHSTNPDEVWLAARDLARQHGLKVSAHMSPRQADPDWFLARYNRRPLEHLADIGVLGPEVCRPIWPPSMNRTRSPGGKRRRGHPLRPCRLPRWFRAGAAWAASRNAGARRAADAGQRWHGRRYPLLRAADGGGLSRCARRPISAPTTMLEMATVNGAKTLGWQDRLGSLAEGYTADLVLHDTRLPEWGGPVFDAVGQWRPARRPRACTACGSPGGRCWRQVAI
jgi:cytosine/adenosine deaminase-related metal-dependent hydrolase